MKPIIEAVERIQHLPRRTRLGAAWGYALLLTYLLVAPAPLAPFGEWGIDTEQAFDRTLSSYFQHLIAYCGFVCIVWWSVPPISRRAVRELIGGVVLHSLVFEGVQYFVPRRHCDWADLLCNLAGVALGVGMMRGISSLGAVTCLHPEPARPCGLPNSLTSQSGD